MTDWRRLNESADTATKGLSAKDIARAAEIARRFDPRSSHAILLFGAAPEKRMADLMASSFANAQIIDVAPNRGALMVDTALMVEDLRRARHALLADIAHFDVFHEECIISVREALVYIRAAEIKLGELQAELAASEMPAADGSSPVFNRDARELADMVSAIDARVHDLKLIATIAHQAVLQMRLVQSGGRLTIERIQSAIKTSQVSFDLCGLVRSQAEINGLR